jgi:SpoIIAA-like
MWRHLLFDALYRLGRPARADTKVGVSHFLSWETHCRVTDVEWIKQTMKSFGFLMPAELRAFPIAEVGQARDC